MTHGRLPLLAALLCATGLALAATVRTEAATPRLEVGIVSGPSRNYDAELVGRLGARHARVGFPIRASSRRIARSVREHAARGARVLLLATFDERIPSAAEARGLARWARDFGPGGRFWRGRRDGHLAVRAIEFGNETSYRHQGTADRGGEYALRFRDAQAAIAGPHGNPRVGLLAQADDANVGSAAWVDAMFAAVPDLAQRVAGWTVHPYGPRRRWQPRIDRLIEQTRARGAPDLPIHVTEYGISTDDGRCLSDNYGWSRCLRFGQAARALRGALGEMRARYGARLASVFVFQSHDRSPPRRSRDREDYFGALRHDMGEKGEFTGAVRALLRSGVR